VSVNYSGSTEDLLPVAQPYNFEWYFLLITSNTRQTTNIATFEVDDALMQEAKTFRLSNNKSTRAIIAKIDLQAGRVKQDDLLEGTSLEELLDELPESSPRFILLSHEKKYADGRVSYPLNLISWIPSACSTTAKMAAASCKLSFASKIAFAGKIIDATDEQELMDALKQ
jgi:hypothetical protein